jgi:hypothetical protein
MYEHIGTNIRYLIVHVDLNGKVVTSSFTEQESAEADKLTASGSIFGVDSIVPTSSFLSIPPKNTLMKASDFIICQK